MSKGYPWKWSSCCPIFNTIGGIITCRIWLYNQNLVNDQADSTHARKIILFLPLWLFRAKSSQRIYLPEEREMTSEYDVKGNSSQSMERAIFSAFSDHRQTYITSTTIYTEPSLQQLQHLQKRAGISASHAASAWL